MRDQIEADEIPLLVRGAIERQAPSRSAVDEARWDRSASSAWKTRRTQGIELRKRSKTKRSRQRRDLY